MLLAQTSLAMPLLHCSARDKQISMSPAADDSTHAIQEASSTIQTICCWECCEALHAAMNASHCNHACASLAGIIVAPDKLPDILGSADCADQVSVAWHQSCQRTALL